MYETIPTFSFGFDHGNATCEVGTITDDNEIRRVAFPSSSRTGTARDIAQAKRLMGKNFVNDMEALEPDDHVLVYKGQSWYVGARALRDAKVPSTGSADKNRYWGTSCVRNILTGIAALLPKDVTHCNAIAVMCLPLKLASNEEAVRKVKQNLNGGPYNIVYNGRSITIQNLKIGKIVAESIGPALKYNPNKQYLTAFFDSGYLTFDYSILRGFDPIPEMCGTIELGVSDIAKHITQKCAQEYQFDLTQQHTEDILHAYAGLRQYRQRMKDDTTLAAPSSVPTYPYIETNDRSIEEEDFERWVRDGCDIIGSQIIEQLASRLGTDNSGKLGASYHEFRLLGGGFYYIEEKFRDIIPSRKIKISNEREFDTVDGLTWFANELVRIKAVAQ